MSRVTHPVLTLADLKRWSRPGTSLAVLGHPIGHSLSPEMHNAALRAAAKVEARFSDWEYFRFDVRPEDLPEALRELHHHGFRGVNLTVPHKIIALGLVSDVDPAAGLVGAVNTLLWTESGWRGFNTDGYGLSAGIQQTLGRPLANSHVILLGAGGAARGAAVECLQRNCASLAIANRTAENLRDLLGLLAPVANGIPLTGFAPAAPTSMAEGALVINATSAGLRPSDPPPIDLGIIPRPAAVFDMIYNPAETGLLRQAAALGIERANGLSMLVHQGAKALEIWSGLSAQVTAPMMEQAAMAALG